MAEINRVTLSDDNRAVLEDIKRRNKYRSMNRAFDDVVAVYKEHCSVPTKNNDEEVKVAPVEVVEEFEWDEQAYLKEFKERKGLPTYTHKM